MDSSNWSEEKKQAAAKRFVERNKKLRDTPAYRAGMRRNHVAIDLSIAVAETELTRQAVAERADMKPGLLTRQLSGDVNLTLDSIGRICEAIGYDFDVVLRKAGEKSASQPWQQSQNRTTYTLMSQAIDTQRTTYKLPPCQWVDNSHLAQQASANSNTRYPEELLAA